jgi:hypothetical protein
MDDDVQSTDRAATLQLLVEKLRSIRAKLPTGLRSEIAAQLEAIIATLEDELNSASEQRPML